ncbi:MAG: hypothetical protein V1815_03180 [Candidatus Woesearchaeota archaeon]
MKFTLNKEFSFGILLGLLAGIFGNLFVTSLYRWANPKPYQDFITFIVGLIFLIPILLILCINVFTKKI